jgi:hypothetical protein
VGWVWPALGTLLGPEGSGFGLAFSDWAFPLVGEACSCGPTPGRTARFPPSGGGGAGAGVGSITARSLRTAQWTRASLFVKLVRAHGGCLGTRSR